MTIAFRVPASGTERVGFAYSPTIEAVLSLHVLVSPSTTPSSTAGCVRCATFLFLQPTGGLTDFEDELAGLRRADPALVLEFAIPLLTPSPGGNKSRDPRVLNEPEVRRLARERVARENDRAHRQRRSLQRALAQSAEITIPEGGPTRSAGLKLNPPTTEKEHGNHRWRRATED